MDHPPGVPAKLTLPGTRRAVGFAETIERAEAAAGRVGITRVADVTGLDHLGLPVVMAVRPAGRSLSVSQGKGTTLEAARASALMESIESHHAEHVDHPLRLASARELGADGYDRLDLLPAAVHSRFQPDLRIPWIEATALDGSGPRWIPFELVDLDRVLPRPYLHGCFDQTSSGLASGNTVDEAVVHALCELIERDAQALWTLADVAHRVATRVDLASVDCPENRALLDRLEDAGVAVGVWDMTSDLGVASYSAVLADRDHQGLRRQPPTAGFGSHLDRSVALSRALTEAVQSRATFIAGSRDDIARRDYGRHRDRANLAFVATLLGEHDAPVRYRDTPSRDLPTFADDIAALLDTLEGAGLGPPLVVDLTRPDVGIPVVKVVAPGLEPERDELAAGSSTMGPRGRRVVEGRSA